MKSSYILKTFTATATVLVLLSGCYQDISDRAPGETYFTVNSTATTTSATEAESRATDDTEPSETISATAIDTTVSTQQTEDEKPITEHYGTFYLSDEYNDFLSECVFVGDSICSGLSHYEILPSEQVYAQGSVAARNIFDFTFEYDGESLSVISVLVNLKPKYIVFSMGMNDLNITSENTYCQNYDYLLSMIESLLPDSKIIVCSITPISSHSNFTTNEKIDNYNTAIKNFIENGGKDSRSYVNVSHELKNQDNYMKNGYDSGDGIHLAPAAYYAMLYQLCEQVVDGAVYPDPHDDAAVISASLSDNSGENTTSQPQ